MWAKIIYFREGVNGMCIKMIVSPLLRPFLRLFAGAGVLPCGQRCAHGEAQVRPRAGTGSLPGAETGVCLLWVGTACPGCGRKRKSCGNLKKKAHVFVHIQKECVSLSQTKSLSAMDGSAMRDGLRLLFAGARLAVELRSFSCVRRRTWCDACPLLLSRRCRWMCPWRLLPVWRTRWRTVRDDADPRGAESKAGSGHSVREVGADEFSSDNAELFFWF